MQRARGASRILPVLLTISAAAALAWGPQADPPQTETPSTEASDQPRASIDAEPECILTLIDGGQMSGRLVSDADSEVVIRVGGVLTRFADDQVQSLLVIEPVLERYRRLRAAIGPKDATQLLMLVEWLLGERQYEVALREVRNVLQLDPQNQRARELEQLLTQQVALLHHASVGDAQTTPGVHRPTLASRPARDPFPTLSPEQINLIRVYEVDLANPPKMSVSRALIETILSKYADREEVPKSPEGREALARRRADQILDLLFRLRARDLYGQVRVEEDPESIHRFRVDVHNEWLVLGCATSRCHGGQSAGRLSLANTKWRSDATVYTNFLILDRYRTSDGRPLVDYAEPAKSLLLQLALPRDISSFPHPIVSELGRERPWHPVIGSPDDARFRKTVRWIRSMYQPHTDYPITYTPPVPAGVEGTDPNRTPRGVPR